MKTQDFLGCVGGVFFLLYVSSLFPIAGPFVAMATPLIFLYYSIKLGRYAGLVLVSVSFVAAGLFAGFSGSPQSFILCLEFSIMGISLSECFRREFSLGQTVFCATFITVLVIMGYLLYFGLTRNMRPIELIRQTLESHLKPGLEIYGQKGISEKDLRNLQAIVKKFIDVFSMISPSLIIVGTGFTVWLNVVLARPFFRMGRLSYPKFSPFDQWRSPEGLVWVVIASGFSLFLFSGGIQLLAINTIIVLLAIYLFHGLSIVQFFFKKYRAPSWLRVGVYFLLVFQQIFLGLLALAGLFDQWVDFRKIQRQVEG